MPLPLRSQGCLTGVSERFPLPGPRCWEGVASAAAGRDSREAIVELQHLVRGSVRLRAAAVQGNGDGQGVG
eukprot:4757653-Alexandrium_andersonii.AAC.1